MNRAELRELCNSYIEFLNADVYEVSDAIREALEALDAAEKRIAEAEEGD